MTFRAGQWCSQDLEVGGTGGPPARSWGRGPSVCLGGEACRKFTTYYRHLAVKPCTILCI